MDWQELKFGHIGRDAEDKVTVAEDVDEHIQTIANRVVDDRYSDEGTITITVKVSRAGPEAVAIEGKVKATVPARRKKAIVGILNEDGEVMTQSAVQQHLPIQGSNLVDMARAETSRKED